MLDLVCNFGIQYFYLVFGIWYSSIRLLFLLLWGRGARVGSHTLFDSLKNKQNSIQTGYRIQYNRLRHSILGIQMQQIWWVNISSVVSYILLFLFCFVVTVLRELRMN